MYKAYDAALFGWARSRGLHVSTTYRDEEVRSIEVVGPAGQRYQIWLAVRATDASATIHAWDLRNRKWSLPTSPEVLSQTLESAYAVVRSWWQKPHAPAN